MKKLFLIFLPYLCFAQTFKGIQITQGTTITYKANQLFESYPNSQGSNPIQNAVPTGWIAWFDPNANITIATGVSQWCDISGTYCLTQATAGNQPTYNSGVRPSLSFNGTTNILSGSGAGLALGTSSYLTVIAVAQLNSISGDVLMNLQSPANGTYSLSGASSVVVGAYNQPTTSRFIATGIPAGGSYTALNLYGIEVDRSVLASSILRTSNNGNYRANATATFSDAGANYSGGTITFGSGANGFCNVKLYDVLIYQRQLSKAEWTSLYYFFKAKYNLP